MSFIGCTAWKSTTGEVATSSAAPTPAHAVVSRLVSTNASHTSSAAAAAGTRCTPSRPATRASGATSSP